MRLRHRLLAIALAFAAGSASAQLGTPMNEMPGVETIRNVQEAPGQLGTQTSQGIQLPAGAINRLFGALPGAGPSTDPRAIGAEIEQSFYQVGGSSRQRVTDQAQTLMQGASPRSQADIEAARAVAGEAWSATQARTSGGVTVNGVSISLPSAQSLQPSGLVPGYYTTRRNDGGTGVSNLFTGTGIPRASDSP